MELSLRRHARACRGHPRLSCEPSARKTWMAGTSPAMTPNKWFNMTGIGCSATKGVCALGIAALLAVASPNAFAADVGVRGPLPVRGPAAVAAPVMTPIPFYNWTGFYVGGNLGGAFEDGTLTDDRFGVAFS